jgi:hypothetical protein
VFLPLVVKRCRTKISTILVGFSSERYRAWYENKSENYLDSVPPRDRDAFADYFKLIYKACTPGHSNEAWLANAIGTAHKIVTTGTASTFSFEEQWTPYDTPTPTSEENVDDYETLEEEDLGKSVIHRFFRKLSRYYSSCFIVVRELAAIRRSGHNLEISIQSVPIIRPTSTPEGENEYPDLDSFLRDRFRVDRRTLDPRKVDKLKDKWRTTWAKGNLVLHAEMQLVLFYATNPQFNPIQNYIGVSKKCCWCCDFVLKYVVPFRPGVTGRFCANVNSHVSFIGTCKVLSPKTSGRRWNTVTVVPMAPSTLCGYSPTPLGTSNLRLRRLLSLKYVVGSTLYVNLCRGSSSYAFKQSCQNCVRWTMTRILVGSVMTMTDHR